MDETLMAVIIFSATWALVGIVFLIIGIVLLNNIKKKEINCTEKVYGKVKDIAIQESYDRDRGYRTTMHPIFEYHIGQLTFVKQSSYGSSKTEFAIGQDVEIYYNPEDYNDYYVVGETIPKTVGTIFTIIGTVGIIVAAIAITIMLIL